MLIKSQLAFQNQTHSQGVRSRRHISHLIQVQIAHVLYFHPIALLSSIAQSASR